MSSGKTFLVLGFCSLVATTQTVNANNMAHITELKSFRFRRIMSYTLLVNRPNQSNQEGKALCTRGL